MAAVEAGEVPGIDGATLLQPGADPPREIGGDAATLVVVDQFEELYTLCRDAAARERFIGALLAHPGPVLIAMRADFYGAVSAHPQLADAVAANQVLLGPMGDDALRRAVTEPARLAGLRLEPGLVDVVLGEVAGAPGALPLLSHALRATWERRDGRTLTIDAYRASGGVASAVAQSADALLETVPAGDRRLLRNLFLRLTELGDGVEDTRRRVPIAELAPQDIPVDDIRGLLDRFADARLLTLDEGTAEVAHEVLIREWPTLRGWLEEDREGLRVHRRLGDAARNWDTEGHAAADLYRGARLGAALDWAQGHPDALNATERAFLDASAAESDRERRAQLRAVRRLRALLAGAGVLLAAAVVAGLLAFRASDDARDSARIADAQRLGAQALIDDRLERSLLLAQAGRKIDDSVATRGYLLSALVRRPAAIGVMQGAFSGVATMALSPDGRILAAGGFNGTILLLDTRTRTRIGRPLRFPHDLGSIDFSPDGRLLAITGSVSEGDPRRVKLVDVATRKVVRTIDAGPYPEDRELHPFVEVRFAADGRAVVVIVQAGNSQAGTFPPYVRRYDVRTGRPLGSAVRIGRRPAGLALTVESRRDRLLFTGPDETSWSTGNAARAAAARERGRGPTGSRRTAATPRSATRTEGSPSWTFAPAGAGPSRAATRTAFRAWSSPPTAAPSRARATTAGS